VSSQVGPAAAPPRGPDSAAETSWLAMNAMAEGVVVLDPAGIVVFANPAFARMIGKPVASLAGHPLTGLDRPGARRLRASLPGLLADGGTLDVGLRHGDTSLPVHLSAQPLATERFRGVVLVATDGSEVQQRLSDAIEMSERRLRTALEAMLDSVMLLSPIRDSDGRIVDFRVEHQNLGSEQRSQWGDRALRFAGRRASELYPQAAALIIPQLVRTATTGDTFQVDAIPVPMEALGFSGGVRYFALKAAACGDDVLLVLREVTESRLAQQRQAELIREREAAANRLAAVLDSAAEGVLVIGLDGKLTLVNRAASEILGRTEAELVGHDWAAALRGARPDDRSHPAEEGPIQLTLREGIRHRRVQTAFSRADGSRVDVEYSAVPLVQDDQTIGAVVIVQDVSERKRADEAFRAFQERLHQAEELAGLGVWMSSLGADRQLVLSPIARRICGFSADTPVSAQEVLDRIHPDDLATVMRYDPRAGDWRSEIRLSLGHGEVRWVAVQARLFEREGGSTPLLLGAVMDITRQKRSQQRLQAHAAQQSRLAALARQGLGGAKLLPLAKGATRVTAQGLGTEISVFALLRDDSMVKVASYGLPRRAQVVLPLSEVPLAGRALSSRNPVAVPDYQHSDIWLSPPLRDIGIRSALAMAVGPRDSPYGVLFAHSLQPRFFSEDDAKWLRSVADVLSLAMERSRVEDDLHATVTELTRLDGQRRALLGHLVTAQEEERHRIAADLHDDVVQLMTAITLRLETLRGPHPEADGGSIDVVQELVLQASHHLREMLFELRPPGLELQGLVAALRAQLEPLTQDTGIHHAVHASVSREPEASARTVLFRIAQEALQNVRKHSGAKRVDVDVETVEEGTLVRIRDDGLGVPTSLTPGAAPGHMGLVVMEERARLAGGWWRITGEPGAGTSVEFWVPGLSRSR